MRIANSPPSPRQPHVCSPVDSKKLSIWIMDSECWLGTLSNPIVIGDGSPASLPARSPVKIVDGDNYRYLKVLALYMHDVQI